MVTGLAVTGARAVAGLALHGRAGLHDRPPGLVVRRYVVVLPSGSVSEITRPRWSRT